jgi:hypothetical protein
VGKWGTGERRVLGIGVMEGWGFTPIPHHPTPRFSSYPGAPRPVPWFLTFSPSRFQSFKGG